VKNIDLDKFSSKQHMIIGEGVKKFLDEYHFFEYYNFRPPDKSIEKVFIYDTFLKETNIVSSDVIIMDISVAKRVLGIEEENCSDILIDIANLDEIETIKTKIRINHFDIRIISKEELYKAYSSFFNYRSSLFIMLYFIALITFIIILYHRYSLVNSIEKKEIGTLRSFGWSINKVIFLKILENIIVFFSAFLIGINFAYFYVFILDAPLLNSIFLGFTNLTINTSFSAVFDFSIFIMLFFVFMIPILASVLIPVWKISLSEPYEVMR
jgi:ABC-type lipoprotein release transport system permease subunit